MEEVRIDGVDVLEDLCVCMYVRWHCLYLVVGVLVLWMRLWRVC